MFPMSLDLLQRLIITITAITTVFQVNLDFRSLDIHPSQLMFRIEEPPVHGRVRLEPATSTGDGDEEEDEEEEEEEGEDEEEGGTTGADEEEGGDDGETFSMLDLWQGRVLYVHSGSEEPRDFFMFSVFFSSSSSSSSSDGDERMELPEVSEEEDRLHRFDVAVRPLNDAPQLSLPAGNILNLLENSRRQVGGGVTDPQYTRR